MSGAAPRARAAATSVLVVVLALPGACTSTVTPPPTPADPTTIWLLGEAMHTGIVLPPNGDDGAAEFVEFGFGDWSWYALGNDSWYHVFGTVLWPSQGALGRRTFGARTADELLARVTWAELSPIVVSEAKARALRHRLQHQFDAGRNDEVQRRDLMFRFVPGDANYWAFYTCADAAAGWLRELDCTVGWAPIRAGLATAPR